MRKQLIFLTILIVPFLQSCEQNIIKDNDKITLKVHDSSYSSLDNESLFKLVSVENNYLVFKDEELANEVSKRLNVVTSTERQAFETRLGFQSLTTLIDKSLGKDSKSGDDSSNQFIKKNTDGSNVVLFALPRKAQILNSEGVVKIGTYLEVFTNTKYIRLKRGILSDLSLASSMPVGDYGNYMVSAIHTMASNSLPGSRLANGSAFLHGMQSQYIMGGSSSSVYYHYYDMYTKYAWYDDGMAPTGGRFIKFEFTASVGAVARLFGPNGPYAYYNYPSPTITLSQLNGDIRVYSGSSPNTGDYTQIFALNGYSFTNSPNDISLASSRAITDGDFHGYLRLNFNLNSSEDGNNLIVYNYDKKDF